MLLLNRAVRRFGVSRQILADQGTQFKSARGEEGVSAFRRHCIDLGIEHITASVRRPTTCGKIEAFHKAYHVESHLFKEHCSFIRYYNYTRPCGVSQGSQSEGQVRPQVNPCKLRFVVDKVKMGQFLLQVLRSSPICIIPPMLDTNFSLIHRRQDVILATDSVDNQIISLL
jgi:hypothetical protein